MTPIEPGADVSMRTHPSYVGRESVSANTSEAHFEFFRIRTDANRNLAGE